VRTVKGKKRNRAEKKEGRKERRKEEGKERKERKKRERGDGQPGLAGGGQRWPAARGGRRQPIGAAPNPKAKGCKYSSNGKFRVLETRLQRMKL